MRSMVRAMTVALGFIAVAGIAGAQGGGAAPLKIGYVNTQLLMEAAPGRAQAESLLKKEGDTYQAQLQKMQDSLNNMLAKYQKDEPTLSAAAKKKAQDNMQGLETEIQGRNLQLQQQFQNRQNEVLAPIQDVVRKVLEDIRVEDGFAMILDKTPGQTPIIVADKNLDITDRVVSRLRATAKPAIPAAGTAPAPKPGAPSTPAGVTARPPGSKPPTR
jgi:outer membrane protein